MKYVVLEFDKYAEICNNSLFATEDEAIKYIAERTKESVECGEDISYKLLLDVPIKINIAVIVTKV